MGIVFFTIIASLILIGAVVAGVFVLLNRQQPTQDSPLLDVRFNNGQVMQLPLHPQRPLAIGRTPDNQLVIDNHLVSRQHARVLFDGAHWRLEDLGSANGTFVNRRPIERVELRPGDIAEIGPAQFQLLLPQAAELPVDTGETRPLHVTGSAEQRDAQEMFGPFVVLRPLDEGGMSKILLGRDTRNGGRQVALKLADMQDDYLQQKFEQEGGLRLHHPHIAQVYEINSINGRAYIAMEYVEGSSLRKLLIGQPWSIDYALAVIGQVLAALEFAHSKQVIHRDIKPENIMISPTAGVKIIDFGVAKLLSSVTRTRDGLIVGTPIYMSYEQASGQPVRPGSDLYAAAIVLYEMLTARTPFNGSDPMAVVGMHLRNDPPSPREFNSAIPSRIEEAILRALEKDHRQRFESARAFSQALGCPGDQQLPAAFNQAITRMLSPAAPPLPAAPPPVVSPQRQRRTLLRFHGGARSGQIIALQPTPLTLGRSDIDPNDMSISRQHVQIMPQNGGFIIQDMSSQGTIVNNQRLSHGTACQLMAGNRIQIGRTVLVCELEA
jgi:serine/threonine protein kinase